MTERKTKNRARRGSGTVFQKVKGGPWHIQYYGPHPKTGEWKCLKEYVNQKNKSDAQALLADRLSRVNKGETVAIGRARPTVDQLFERLIRETENEESAAARAGSRKAEGQRWLWAHLKPFFGYRFAEQVSGKLATQYTTNRLDVGAAPATVNRELAMLRRILRRGKERGDLHGDLPTIHLLPENNKRMNFINDVVFHRMAEEAAKEGLWLRALLEVAWKYGWRRGEMLNLRVGDVDFHRRALRLETSKNGEPREVWMDDDVLEFIRWMCEGKGPEDTVFTRPDGQPVRDFRGAWQNLCIRAGAPAPDKLSSRFECLKCKEPMAAGVAKCKCGGHRRYIGLLVHDMRRSAARAMVNAGVAEIDVMNTTGHKTASMLRRYAIHDLGASRRVMERRAEAATPPGANNPPTTPNLNSTSGKATVTIQ